jgi:hypothetical protein
MHVDMRNAYKIVVGKPEGKRQVGRSRSRWEYNIRIYLQEIGWEGVNWICLAQDRDQWWVLFSLVMKLWVPQDVGNFLTS